MPRISNDCLGTSRINPFPALRTSHDVLDKLLPTGLFIQPIQQHCRMSYIIFGLNSDFSWIPTSSKFLKKNWFAKPLFQTAVRRH